MSVVAAETQTALRARVRDYLRDNGTLAPTAVIRRRVTTAFENLEHFLRAADPTRAARRAWPAEWSLHEIADHVLETHRPSRDELRDLPRYAQSRIQESAGGISGGAPRSSRRSASTSARR